MTFGRKTYVRPPQPHYAPIPADRRGVMAVCGEMTRAIPRSEPKRNPHLLSMARGKPCLLLIAGVCNGDTDTTVAAHSNLLMHNKGRGRKADDCYSVWACARCHTWLDSSYAASGTEKEMAFMLAHLSQVEEWRAIAGGRANDPKHAAAARWALEQINATPIGQGEAE